MRLRTGDAKERQNFVPYELADDTRMCFDNLYRSLLQLPHQNLHLLRVQLLSHRREAREIREEHGSLATLPGGRGNGRCRGRRDYRRGISSGTISWLRKSVPAISAELVCGRIGRLALGAHANQWLATFATETIVIRVCTATIVAVHNVPASVAELFLWPMAISREFEPA